MPRKSAGKKPTSLDEREIRRQYVENLHRYNALKDEVDFILTTKIPASIKLHSIEGRVKTADSLIAKARRQELRDPLQELNDIVGTRVVCLFRSDLDALDSLIRRHFDVISSDDKVLGSTDSLGYLSIHYVCKMPRNYTGPRYDDVRKITFEIQTRTLCMHCWAAVSHYLDYKADWDVPQQLKLSLNALSGLFFVADNEFQQFYQSRQASQAAAIKQVAVGEAEEINLDTITALIGSLFPDRDLDEFRSVSGIVQEVKAAGYNSITSLASDLERAAPAVAEYEKQMQAEHAEEEAQEGTENAEPIRLNRVGALRVSLHVLHPHLLSQVYAPIAETDSEFTKGLYRKFANFQRYVRPK